MKAAQIVASRTSDHQFDPEFFTKKVKSGLSLYVGEAVRNFAEPDHATVLGKPSGRYVLVAANPDSEWSLIAEDDNHNTLMRLMQSLEHTWVERHVLDLGDA